jgi:Ankyrin repeats (many copies)
MTPTVSTRVSTPPRVHSSAQGAGSAAQAPAATPPQPWSPDQSMTNRSTRLVQAKAHQHRFKLAQERLAAKTAQSSTASASLEPEQTIQLSLQAMQAALAGDVDEIKSLVSQGANVHAKDQHGATVCIRAAIKGRSNVVDFLVNEHQVDVNQTTPNGLSAAMVVAGSGHIDTLKAPTVKQR